MKIEEIRNSKIDLIISLNLDGRAESIIRKYICELENQNIKLEADKLEMAKAVVSQHIRIDFEGDKICTYCKRLEIIGHSDNCIVNKANKYIKEVEK